MDKHNIVVSMKLIIAFILAFNSLTAFGTGQTIYGDLVVNGKSSVVSTTKGSIVCPKMTEAQRDAIASPASGDCVYNTTTLSLNVYNGSAWKAAGGGVNQWLTSTSYQVNDVVIQSNLFYICLSAHTSGTFATDLAAAKWQLINASIKAKAQNASSVVATEIQFPNDTLTQTASGKYLAVTGNNNILANPGFEHSSVQTSWSLTNGSSAVETSAVIQGQQSIKLTLTAQTLEFFQTSTRYAAQFADGVQGAASIRVKTTVSGVFACPVQNSAIQYSLCAAHSGDGKWALLKVPFVLGGTNNGIAIISGTMSSGTVTPGSITGTVYVDDAYVGTDAGIADVSIITPWVAFTPTFTGFGTVSINYCKQRQNGSNREIDCKFTAGSTTAVEGRISLPSGDVVVSDIPTIKSVGVYFRNNAGGATTSHGGAMLAEPSLSYLTFSPDTIFGSASSNVFSKAIVSTDIAANTDVLAIQASVPIANLAGSTQVFASQCGAACETSLTANVTGATGAISAQKIPGALSSSRSATGVYTISYTGLTVVPAITFDTSSPCTQSYISTAATSSAVGITTRNNSGVNADCDFTVTVDKQGADYISSRTITGSFKEVPKTPGANSVEFFSFSYGTTNATTVCSASPCSYFDAIGGGATSLTRASAGNYTAVFSKTFSKVKCSGAVGSSTNYLSVYGTSSCSNCSSLNILTGSSTSATDSYGTITCIGVP
jgi:hypothetical protein